MNVQEAIASYEDDEREILWHCIERLRAQGWTLHRKQKAKQKEFLVLKFTERPCSACNRKGLVPAHHKFLCLVCWAKHLMDIPVFTECHAEQSVHDEAKLSDMYLEDGEDSKHLVVNEVVYSSKTMTQYQLQRLVPSMNTE